jgi:hypothetical protein
VTEARCGWIDEEGASSPVVPGGGLSDVLGCRERELLPVAKTSPIRVTAAHEALPLLRPGDALDALFFEESFDVFGGDSRVLAEFSNGRPAIVYAPFGKGRALIVGSFPGSAYHHFKNAANGKFFAGLAEWLKIARPVEVSVAEPGAMVEARILEGDGYRILFGFNRGETRATAKFSVAMRGGGASALDLETRRSVPCATGAGRAVVEKALGPSEVWVVHVSDK